MITPTSARTARQRALLLAALVALVPAAAGCGTKSADQPEKSASAPIDLDQPEETPETPETTAGSRTAKPGSGGISKQLVAPFDINQTIWFTGLKIELGRATVDAEESSLTITGEALNEGSEPAGVSLRPRLEQGGVDIDEGYARSQTSILGGSSAAVTIEFSSLPETFDPAKAVLIFGAAKDQQVRVPLKGQGPVVSRQPIEQKAPGAIRAGSLELTTESMSVRYDNPADHSQAAADKAFLVLDGSVRFDNLPTNFQGQHFQILPPNGSPQSGGNLNALPRQGSSQDTYVVFTIPTPVGGDYTLRIKGTFIASDARFHPDKPVTMDTKITLTGEAPAAPAGAAKGS